MYPLIYICICTYIQSFASIHIWYEYIHMYIDTYEWISVCIFLNDYCVLMPNNANFF